MNRQKFIKDYLSFSKKDRIGILSILFIIGFVYFLPRIFSKNSTQPSITTDSLLLKVIDTLNNRQTVYKHKSEADEDFFHQQEPVTINTAKAELFEFDPNTLSIDGWQKLGLSAKTATTINNYRSKGGKFYQPDDIKKIWGLPAGFYERVKSFIKISSVQKKYKTVYSTLKHKPIEYKIAVININETDTTALIALPGIGSKLASRIINFRDKLGGFYAVEQIGETYGLPDSTFQKLKGYFKAEASSVHKININEASKEELKAHPYIRWNLANVIVEYRNQHGSFISVEDLKKIALITDELFEKIAPYVSL